MGRKGIIYLMLINIVLGNAILYFSNSGALVMSFIGGSKTAQEQLLLHILCSAIAATSILFTSKTITTKPQKAIILFVFAIVGAVLVPFLSTFIMFTGFNILNNKFIELFGNALLMVISSTAFSSVFWLPFAIGNLIFYIYLNKQSKLHIASQVANASYPSQN